MSIIIPYIGQSNHGGATDTYPIVGVHWRLEFDGVWQPLKDADGNQLPNLHDDSDCQHDQQHNQTGRYGYQGALGDGLLSLAETICFVPCHVGGSTSTNWIQALTDAPPTLPTNDTGGGTSFPNAAKYRIRKALRATGARLGPVIIYQGESNAAGFETVANWTTHWTAICNEFATFFAAQMLGAKKFLMVKLSPIDPPPHADWEALRSAQDAFVAGRTDTVLVEAPATPIVSGEPVHLDTGTPGVDGTRRLGELLAAAILANDFGL